MHRREAVRQLGHFTSAGWERADSVLSVSAAFWPLSKANEE